MAQLLEAIERLIETTQSLAHAASRPDAADEIETLIDLCRRDLQVLRAVTDGFKPCDWAIAGDVGPVTQGSETLRLIAEKLGSLQSETSLILGALARERRLVGEELVLLRKRGKASRAYRA